MTATANRALTVAVLGTTQTLSWGSSYYLPAILATPIAGEFGISRATVFGIFSVALLLTALLGPAAGRAIDTRGGRDVLAVSNLVFAAGLALMGFAPGPVVFGLAWAVLGVAMAMGLYDAAFATLAGLYGKDARNSITGITLIAGFASTVGWPLTALMDAEWGWRGACYGWAVLHVVLGLPLNRLLIPRVPPPERAAAVTAAAGPEPRMADMALLAFVLATAGFSASALGAHLPGLLQAAGTTAAAAVAAGTLLGPAQVGARILEFGFLRKISPLVSARIAAAAHPIAVAVLLAGGAPMAAVFVLIHGAGNGMLTITRGTLPLALFGPVGYGQRQGFITAPARASQAFAPYFFGLLVDAYGAQSLLLTAGLGLAAVAALFVLRAR
ncbi:MFS transporter [Neoroseomonas oryzicola]|uniref:MFS transporter n=1 Tax=Neoroseomonas oryzicola TaxID=535904 RepID=A0A9X9WMF4_9PROT|nr:MFS transporter [Neoroseomonas oryzicola]MBR0661514.1 MFS transporter [Neoroseomonas oryzicola]NKE19074.1 MFS transporter [Neoroseomonas oryzicola]